MKYAVVENGRNQILLKEGDKVFIDELSLEKGTVYKWSQVMLFKDEDDLKIGTPYLKEVAVTGKVGDACKGPKVINFKKKRRKGYSKKIGHRQKYTEVIVEEIK